MHNHDSVTTKPFSPSQVEVGITYSEGSYPNMDANMGVKKVRELSVVKLPEKKRERTSYTEYLSEWIGYQHLITSLD